MTKRERMIRAILATPSIFDGCESELRRATSRMQRDGRMTIAVSTMSRATLELPEGYGDRAVWHGWGSVRDTADIRATGSNGHDVIVYA